MNSYNKTFWVDRQTWVNASNLNKVENQLESLTDKAIEHTGSINTYKQKLDDHIANHPAGDSNVQADWNVTDTKSDAYIKNKPTIPKMTSQLTNDMLFTTESFVTTKIAEAQLGGGDADLSGLATKDELATKVDKVTGKSLVSDTEITRLASIVNYTHPNDVNTRHVTDAEKTAWNAKSNFSGNYNDLTNKPTVDVNKAYVDAELAKKINSAGHVLTDNNYTNSDKTKLAGLVNYTHPNDASTRHVTDADKSNWNSKLNATYPSNLAQTVTKAIGGFGVGDSLTGMSIASIIEKLLCGETTVTESMWYGRIPKEELSVPPVIPYTDITASHIKNCSALTKTTPDTMNKVSFGLSGTGDYLVVVVPKSKGYVVKKDNGIGGKVIFDEDIAGANGVNITIDGIDYLLYGEILTTPTELFIYVD